MRTLFPKTLAGVDRSRKSHVATNGVYDLLNLRPKRGELVQTLLVGTTIINLFDQDYWIFEVEQ
jgi:hypothetical protein